MHKQQQGRSRRKRARVPIRPVHGAVAAGAIAAVALLWPTGVGAETSTLNLCPGEKLVGSEYTFPTQPADSTPQSLDQATQSYLQDAYDGLIPPWVEARRISHPGPSIDWTVQENLVPRALLRFEEITPERWELAGYLACESWAAARDLNLRGAL